MSTSELQKTESYRASDGYEIHYRHWRPARQRPRGYVVTLHGIQSHSGWYEDSCKRQCDAGYDIRFLDRRGSGLNQADRGHAPGHYRLINDVVECLVNVRARRDSESPDSPVILIAVSWGAKLGVNIAAMRPDLIDALGLLYPGIYAKVKVKWYQRFLVRLGFHTGWARAKFRIPLDDPRLFSTDLHWQNFIREDPLALHHATVGFLHSSLQLDRLAVTAPQRIHCPALLMLAGHDKIIDNWGTRRFFEQIASTQRRVIEYSTAEHTLEFEPERDDVVADLIEWMDSIRPTTAKGQQGLQEPR